MATSCNNTTQFGRKDNENKQVAIRKKDKDYSRVAIVRPLQSKCTIPEDNNQSIVAMRPSLKMYSDNTVVTHNETSVAVPSNIAMLPRVAGKFAAKLDMSIIPTCSHRIPAVTRVHNITETTMVQPKNMMDINISDVVEIMQQEMSPQENPFYCSEYVEDIFQYMLQSEVMDCYRLPRDYLSVQVAISPNSRAILIDWLISVHIQFKLLQETLHITIDILDRYLKANTIDKHQLQLLGVTSMFLASKYEEVYPPCVADFTYITADTYTPKQICEMEQSILISLDYRINKPFSLQFLRRYSRVTNSTIIEHSMAKFILEKAMMDCYLVTIRPSLRAVGSLVLAYEILRSKHAKESIEQLRKYTDFTSQEVISIKRKLRSNLDVSVNVTKLDAVVKKYSSKELMEVAKYVGVKSKKRFVKK